jgi:excisionase family DNA binding protein
VSPVSASLSTSPYLTLGEVANYLGVSRRTVEYWVAAEIIPSVELPGRIRRFDRIAIDSWVRDHAVPARAEGRRR